jgi:hypothetical protein
MTNVWNGSRLENGHELADLDVHAWQIGVGWLSGYRQARLGEDSPSKYPLPGS